MINEKNIFDKGMLIAVHSGYYEGRKKLSQEQLKDLPAEIVRGVHDVFDKEFKEMIRAIGHHNGETRNMIKMRAVPFPIDGVYFVKSDAIENIVKMIDEREQGRIELINEAVKHYDTAIEAFATKYPEFYERVRYKYISKDEFSRRFYFTYQFIKISAPEKNAMITSEQYKMEMRKFHENIENMKREVVSTIYQVLSEMTARLKKQCKNDKPNQRTFNNLCKFLNQIEETYEDFIDREDLKSIVKKIKAQTLGVTAESLRNSEDAKAKFEKGIKALANEIQALPDIQLKRAIDF